NPVACQSPDHCHAAGTCNPNTGQCSVQPSICCGNGVRDLPDEECDPGSPSGNLACLASCKGDDFLAVTPSQPPALSLRPERSPGAGRHTIAGASGPFAVVYSQQAPSVGVSLQVLSGAGQRLRNVDLGSGTTALLQSNPVVAALPGDMYAAAWNDFGTGGD